MHDSMAMSDVVLSLMCFLVVSDHSISHGSIFQKISFSVVV